MTSEVYPDLSTRDKMLTHALSTLEEIACMPEAGLVFDGIWCAEEANRTLNQIRKAIAENKTP